MSDEDTIGAGEHGDLSAAEYVLGVLGAEERRQAEFRIASEPRFGTEVAFWETRLGGLAGGVRPVVPPTTVWNGIESRLSAALAPVPKREGLWQNLAFWRTFAIASTALAAASMAGLIYLAQVPSFGPPLLAQLNTQSGQASFVAAVNQGEDSVTIVPAAVLSGSQQKVFELWLIPPGLNSCRSVLQQLGEQQKVACECLHKSTRIDPHKTRLRFRLETAIPSSFADASFRRRA